ncbi:MAG: hypothetical protein L0Y58_20230 [Verrucomicrobia subdivision 3 bacterium]|nr:hypothetical protein [Limisphaerales bacterium]
MQIRCRYNLAAKQGFSILEGLIGAVIMGTLFVSLYAGMTGGFSSIRRARENLRASQILLEKFETIRLYNWEQINTPGFVPATFTNYYAPNAATRGTVYYGRVVISTNLPIPEVYNEDMRLVDIELAWQSGSTTCTRNVLSLVARYGLQHYIY